MFAVVKTGGKRYKVAQNDIIKVEKLTGDAGSSIDLADVLMVGDGEGWPLVRQLLKALWSALKCWSRRRATRLSSSKEAGVEGIAGLAGTGRS